jgi:hypothetical protein
MAEWLRRGLQIRFPWRISAIVRTIHRLFRAWLFNGLCVLVLTRKSRHFSAQPSGRADI